MEKEDWDLHISAFLKITDKLGCQDQVLSKTYKITKLPRTLPASLDALAVISSLTNLSFYNIINVTSANIERQKKLGSWNKAIVSAYISLQQPLKIAAFFTTPNFRGAFSGRGSRFKGKGHNTQLFRTCRFCGKGAHFIKSYKFCINDKDEGRN